MTHDDVAARVFKMGREDKSRSLSEADEPHSCGADKLIFGAEMPFDSKVIETFEAKSQRDYRLSSDYAIKKLKPTHSPG